MGKVFSVEEVSAGLVPEVGAHHAAARFVLDELFEQVTGDLYVGAPGVDAALVYGSTVHEPNRRSDVDVLLVYDATQAAVALPGIRTVLQAAETRYRVPIEEHVVPRGALKNPLEHNIDPLFMRHLVAVQRNQPHWQRNSPIPASLFANSIDRDRVVEIAVAYCSGKAQQFARALMKRNDAIDLHTLQRAFELPATIGRKVLVAIFSDGLAPKVENRIIFDKGWTTQLVKQLLESIGGVHAGAADQLGKLATLNSDYSRLLEATLAGQTTTADYATWLSEHAQLAYQLAHDTSYSWTEVLKMQLDGGAAPRAAAVVREGETDY